MQAQGSWKYNIFVTIKVFYLAFQLLCDVNELQEWKKAVDRDSFFFKFGEHHKAV